MVTKCTGQSVLGKPPMKWQRVKTTNTPAQLTSIALLPSHKKWKCTVGKTGNKW